MLMQHETVFIPPPARAEITPYSCMEAPGTYVNGFDVQASHLSLVSINTSSWKESLVSVIASSPNSTLHITMKAVFAICAAMVAGAQVRWSERISILQLCHVRACGGDVMMKNAAAAGSKIDPGIVL